MQAVASVSVVPTGAALGAEIRGVNLQLSFFGFLRAFSQHIQRA